MKRRTAEHVSKLLRTIAAETHDKVVAKSCEIAANAIDADRLGNSRFTTAEAAVICGLTPVAFRRVAQLAQIGPVDKRGNELVWSQANVEWVRDHRPKPGKPGHRGTS